MVIRSGSAEAVDPIEEFLGSTHVFALALQNVLEARILREIVGAQLTSVQIKVLKLIAEARARSIGDVASFLGVSDPAASKTVDRLVRAKLVRRTEQEADRRASELALTLVGRRIISEYEGARRRRLAEVFAEVAPEDLERTAALLDRVAASIVARVAGTEKVCLQCGLYQRQKCLFEQAQRPCTYRERAGRRESGEES